MYFKNFIYSLFALAIITTYSCSTDDQIQDETVIATESTNNSEFADLFVDYNSSIVRTRTALRITQEEDGTNPLAEKIINSNTNPERFKRNMDEYYQLMNGKDLLEMFQIQKDLGAINQKQYEFLADYGAQMKSNFDAQESKVRLLTFTQLSFETWNLETMFSEDEIPILQFMGLGFMQSLTDLEETGNQRTCETGWQKFVCGSTAVLASATFGAVAYAAGTIAGTFGWCDEFLSFIGLDPLNVPNWLEELLPDTIFGVSTEFLICGAAAAVGIYEFTYDWCCNTLYGCDEDEDPCCAIDCPTGYSCVNGECEPILWHCIHTGCPDGYTCSNITGTCRVTPDPHGSTGCNDDSDCDPDWYCFKGNCHPH